LRSDTFLQWPRGPFQLGPGDGASIIFLICLILGHRRSRSRAWFVPEQGKWRSFCRRCGTPMLREKGKWRRDEV
jgi:hypothetical protein